jgi:hypothetical protein
MSATFNPQVDLSWRGSPAPLSMRRLGDNREPLRRLYFLDFPLLLLSVGLLTWVLPTDTMLAVSSFVGAVVGLYSLWEIVIRRGPIRFAHFFCVANTVGYGFGALNSWLTISRGTMSLADFFNRDTAAVSHAMAAVLISSGILYALGEIYETPIFGTNFRLKLDNRAAAFVFFGTALIIVGYATGSMGYMGINAIGNGGHVSVLAGLLGWLFPTLFAFTALTFLEWPKGMLKLLNSEESIADTQFNFACKDEANSLYTAGAIDFGFWGMMVYPILIWILFRSVAEIIRVNSPEMVPTIIILALLYNSLITEAGLWVHLLAVRDSILFSAFSFKPQPQTGAFHP